jgi:hypothetical protein
LLAVHETNALEKDLAIDSGIATAGRSAMDDRVEPIDKSTPAILLRNVSNDNT